MFTELYPGIHEEPLPMEGAAGSIHAMLYWTSVPPRATVVVAAPDGEERAWAERSLVTSARALARAGYAVLRFDNPGQGESDGEYAVERVDGRIDCLRLACSRARERTGQLPAVLGARLGASVAVATARSASIERLILWEPVLDTRAYVMQLLRVNASMQMVLHGKVLVERDELLARARAGERVSANGFELSGPFIDDLLALNVPAVIGGLSIPVRIFATRPVPPAVAALPHVKSDVVGSQPFWKEPKIHFSAPPAFLEGTLAELDALARVATAP